MDSSAGSRARRGRCFSLGMLQADIIGALLVLGFLRFGLPPSDRVMLQDLPTLNLVIFF